MKNLIPTGGTAYRSARQQIASWILLALGMVVPGILLAVNPAYWLVTQILHQALGFTPLMVGVIGLILATFGVLAFVLEDKDIPYTVAMIFYALIAVATFIVLCQGGTVGALFIAPLLVAWLYYVAASFATQRIVAEE